MREKIILEIIGYLIPAMLGFGIRHFLQYFKKERLEQKALMILLQNNLTNTYFIYN